MTKPKSAILFPPSLLTTTDDWTALPFFIPYTLDRFFQKSHILSFAANRPPLPHLVI
jgi:hypothetical protein